MEITGQVLELLPEQSGQGKNGTWRKREFILEANNNTKYPKKVCISVWGEKIDQFNLRQGETITASIEVESREYNGKWYTDVKAWKVSKSSSDGGTRNDAPPIDAYRGDIEATVDRSAEDDTPF